MKIAARAIEPFLVHPEQSRAALIYGPDSGLARERAGRIREKLLQGNDDPFAYVELEASTLLDDPARLSDELLAVSFLSPKRFFLIRSATDKLTRLIEECLPHLNESVYLVMLGEELSSRSSLRLLFEKDPKLASIACYRDEVRDIQDLVRKHFAEAKIEVNRDVMDYISQQLGNDRGVTQQELSKMALFAGESGRLSLEEAQSLVDYNKDTGLDDIVQAVADRSLASLDAMLEVQLREGTQPIAYLRALQRYFNRLYFIRARMSQGESMEQVIAGLKPKVFYKQEDALKRHVHSWDTPQIVKALGLLVRAELACKTSDLPIVPASSRRLLQVTQLR